MSEILSYTKQTPLKRRHTSTRPHGVTSQKIMILQTTWGSGALRETL